MNKSTQWRCALVHVCLAPLSLSFLFSFSYHFTYVSPCSLSKLNPSLFFFSSSDRLNEAGAFLSPKGLHVPCFVWLSHPTRAFLFTKVEQNREIPRAEQKLSPHIQGKSSSVNFMPFHCSRATRKFSFSFSLQSS